MVVVVVFGWFFRGDFVGGGGSGFYGFGPGGRGWFFFSVVVMGFLC